MEITSRLTPVKSITAVILALAVCAAVYFALPQSVKGNQYILQVKSGHPFDYPSITYDAAYNRFFSDPSWQYESRSDRNLVIFTGGCQYNGKPATVSITFLLMNNDTFMPISATIDGAALNNSADIASIANKPFENYK